MTEHTPTADQLLTTAQAAEALQLRSHTLDVWRCEDLGPPFVRLNRTIRYRRGDLVKWVDDQRIEPGAIAKAKETEHDDGN